MRAAFFSKLDNTVNNNSIFNTKYAGFSTIYKIRSFIFTTLLVVHTTTLKSPLKIRSSTSVNFYLHIPHLLIHKIILPISTSSIPQQFFTFLFLRTTIPTIYPKNIFLPQPFRRFRLRQGIRELGSLVRNDTVLTSPFFLKV